MPELRRTLYVVGSQVIATAPVPDLLDGIGWRDGASICDSQAQVLYYQRTPRGPRDLRPRQRRASRSAAIRRRLQPQPRAWPGNIRELHRVYPSLRGVRSTTTGPGRSTACPSTSRSSTTCALIRTSSSAWASTGPVSLRRRSPAASSPASCWNAATAGARAAWSALRGGPTLPPEPFRYIGAQDGARRDPPQNDAEIGNRKPAPMARLVARLAPGSGES